MEVLKHGDAWKEKHNITTCRSCGCEFIYNEDDTEELIVYARTLRHPIRCPECGNAVYMLPPTEEDKEAILNKIKVCREDCMARLICPVLGAYAFSIRHDLGIEDTGFESNRNIWPEDCLYCEKIKKELHGEYGKTEEELIQTNILLWHMEEER